jgi:hypothetical protein
LNPDITDATSVLKELMLSPEGTVFDPLAADPPDDPEDPQAAAARLTTAARLTQATGRSERERRPPLLICIPKPLFTYPEEDTRKNGCGEPYSTHVRPKVSSS